MRRKARMRIIIFFLTVTLGVLALSQARSENAFSAAVRKFPAAPPTGTYFDHLVFIMMENWGIQNICGGNPTPSTPCNGADNPYMSSLARNFTIGSQYTSVIHPLSSEPNYVAIIGGSTFSCPSSCTNINAPTLVDRFQNSGLAWKAYMENQQPSAGCDTSSSHEPYNSIHNPFISFSEFVQSGVLNATLCSKILLANPSGCGSVTDCTLVNDLNNASAPAPNFMWLTPNDCNNMHGASVCANGCTSASTGSACRQKGDSYLKSLVPNILKSRTFTTSRSALFITFDEGQDFCPLNGSSSEDCVYALWAGPVAKTGFISSTLYNHYSFLKTIESNWNLATLTTNDAGATAMAEFFNAQAPDFTITATPSSLAFPFGNSANSTITLSSLGSFAGTVTLTKSSTPAGLTLTLNPTSITLAAGGTGTSTLAVSSSTIGNYTATVTGTGGGHTHNTTLTVRVTPPPNFALSVSPTSLTLTHTVSGVASPVTIGPTSDRTVFESSYLTNSFYAKGLYWLFYEDSSNTCEHQAGCLTYTTSTNGSRWASSTTVPVHITDSDFSVTTNGTSVFYVRYNETTYISDCGRKVQLGIGILASSGTVAWQPERTVIAGASNRVYADDEIVLDSNGQIWIAYMMDNHGSCGGSSTDLPLVIHSAGTNYNSWTGNFTFNNVLSGNWHISLVSLGNGQVYAAYWIGAHDVHGRLYNSAWQSDEQISSTTTLSDVNSWLFNSGTNVYTLYFDDRTESFNFAARSSTGTWTVNTIGVGESHTGFPNYYSLPDAAGYDPANNQFHLFYMNATTQRIDEWTGSGSSWNKTTVVSTTAVPYADSITSFIQSNPTQVGGLFYISGSSSPFTLNFAQLTFASANLTGTFTATVTGQNGFTGTVNLNPATVPSTGLTVTCSTTTITGGSGSSLCSLSSTTVGSYNVNVTGVSGSLSHSANVAVTVPAGPDFTITATSPTPANVGQSPTSAISVNALNGFTGIVSLTDTPPPGLVCSSISPNSITNSGTATVSCSASVAGNYSLTLTGTSGSLIHSTTALFQFRDFNASASFPAPLNVGSSAISTITLTAMNHFSGTVSLTDIIPSGLLCGAINPSSIAGSGTSTVSCNSSIAGNYTLTISATSGSLVHNATSLFQFRDFTIAAVSVSVNAGTSGISTITISAINRFAGTVTLSESVPSGLACGSTSPSSITGSGTATVSCSATAAGNYTLTVTGTSGTLVHMVSPIFHVQDFGIAASSPAPINTGSSATTTITISAINHFGGIISLTDTAPSGLTCGTITPNGVTGSGTGTVSCSVSVAGNYTLTVTGTSSSLVHSSTALLQFRDFTISTALPGPVNAGVSANLTITVSALNHFTGQVSLTDTIPSGINCGSITPSTLAGSGTAAVTCSSSVAGNYTLAVTGTNSALSHTATVTITIQDYSITSNPANVKVNAGSTGTSIITITPLNHFSGTVSLTTSGTTGLITSINPASLAGGAGSATLSFRASSAGNYTVTVTGSTGAPSHTTTVNVQIVDFAIAANPPSITLPAGAVGNSTITITGINGFSGTVNLALASPMGLAATATPTSIAGAGSSALSASAFVSGDYSVTIKATSGSLSHTISAVIHVVDYSLAGNPANIVAPIGSSPGSTLTIQSLNKYAGNLTLTYTVQATAGNSTGGGFGGGSHGLILAPPGVFPSVSFNPQSFGLASDRSQQSTVSISLPQNLPPVTYLITIVASDGTLSHQIVITIAATDFSLTGTPTSVSLRPGSNATILLNLKSLNLFQGNVSLAVTTQIGGPTGTLSTSIVQLNPYSTVNINLTISVPANTSFGNYTVTVQATSGTVSQTLIIPVKVSATGFATILAAILGSQISSAITVMLVVALVATYAWLRIRTHQTQELRLSARRISNRYTHNYSAPRHRPYSSNVPLLWTLTSIEKS